MFLNKIYNIRSEARMVRELEVMGVLAARANRKG